jgi:hypothetical protein
VVKGSATFKTSEAYFWKNLTFCRSILRTPIELRTLMYQIQRDRFEEAPALQLGKTLEDL